MGFGDPYHMHPLKEVSRLDVADGRETNCFHCELPITEDRCLSCLSCDDHYIHKMCHDLPKTIMHPLHDQHPLTFSEPPSFSNSPNLCNECQNPCLGRFSYHCLTCQYFLHLKCLFSLKHEKHNHPLILAEKVHHVTGRSDCKICGFPVRLSNFGCMSCDFYIHHECSLIAKTIKRHHVHELTIRHNFPEECDQVYCDLCEDKDGELDRTLSYYYCKRCDYIAHVHCCITQQMEDVVLYERFTHNHPLRRSADPVTGIPMLNCSQCVYVANLYSREYPSKIKHPLHPEHTLAVVVDQEKLFPFSFNCTECQFTMNEKELIILTHPLWRYNLQFECSNRLFRCDACGELGRGSRVGYFFGEFDLHLGCFALPGKLLHKSHQRHSLYLRWLDISTSRSCNVCNEEMDPRLWFYFCEECDYAAHLDCVESDLLFTIRSSINNEPDFCAFSKPDKTLFECQIADIRPPESISVADCKPLPPTLNERNDDDDDDETDLGIERVADELHCPNCNLLITTKACYSTIKDWESSNSKILRIKSPISANNQTPSTSQPSSVSDEKLIDGRYCHICHVLVFPPMYSCGPCQIFFHKSCAELPPKISFNETKYVLMAPPFPEGFSDCSYCEYPISGYAYLSLVGRKIFDLQCASRAPLMNQIYHEHDLFFQRDEIDLECGACTNVLETGALLLGCEECDLRLHPECGLLPPVIMHYRAHQHPLELATDLAELYDEYVCDVCEKDLNPNLWAYRCVDECGIRATSHVTCVITSEKKCHFKYDQECENMTEKQKLEFKRTAKRKS